MVIILLVLVTIGAIWAFSSLQDYDAKKKQEKKQEQEAKESAQSTGCFLNLRVTNQQIKDEINESYFNLTYTSLDEYPVFAHDMENLNGPARLKEEAEAEKHDLSEEEQNQVGAYLMTNNGEVLDSLDLIKARADQPESKVV